jgi:hypothetical protein
MITCFLPDERWQRGRCRFITFNSIVEIITFLATERGGHHEVFKPAWMSDNEKKALKAVKREADES